jgi:hypothetical protein
MRAGRHSPRTAASAGLAGELVAEGLVRQRLQDAGEAVGVVRCPCCRAELVARMGRRRPYFACRCVPRRDSR